MMYFGTFGMTGAVLFVLAMIAVIIYSLKNAVLVDDYGNPIEEKSTLRQSEGDSGEGK